MCFPGATSRSGNAAGTLNDLTEAHLGRSHYFTMPRNNSRHAGQS